MQDRGWRQEWKADELRAAFSSSVVRHQRDALFFAR